MKRLSIFAVAAAVLALAGPAFGQAQLVPTAQDQSNRTVPSTPIGVMVAPAAGAKGKGKVVALDFGFPVQCLSGCAAPVSFTPLGAATLAAGTSSARVAFPTGPNFLMTNNGSTDLYYQPGNSSVVATTSSFLLPAGRSIVITNGANTHVAAITASLSTSLSLTGGTGVPTISGGGGTGGGGGGDATAANQVTQITNQSTQITNQGTQITAVNLTNTNLGALGSAVAGADTGTFNINAMIQRTNSRLSSILTALGTPFQAGGSIGNTSFGISGTLPAFAATPAFNQTQINGVAMAAGNGVAGTGVQRVVIASDNAPFSVNAAITGTLPAFAATPTFNCGTGCAAGAGTAQGAPTSGVTGGLNLWSVTASAPSYTTATVNAPSLDTHGSARVLNMDSLGNVLDPNAATPAGTNTIGGVNLRAATTGGATALGQITTASTNAIAVKTSAGTFYGGVAVNTTATLAYLRLYNLAAAPTCSSSTGYVTTIPIPASTSGNGTKLDLTSVGIDFPTGIAGCVTGGGANNDNTNAPAGVYLTYAFK